MAVEAFVVGIVAVFGLIWGSYLNVLVYRLPKGLSTAIPSSHCPRCSSRILPIDNVPVLSWMLLGARCRRCRGAISARYPLIEASVAALFVLGFRRFDEPLEILVSWILGCILLALALIDFDRRLVPIVLTLPVGVAGWVLQPSLGWTTPLDAVVASLLGAGLLVGLSVGWRQARGGSGPGGLKDLGLGLGDVYGVFLVGAFFGTESTLLIVLWAAAGAVAILLASRSLAALQRLFGRAATPIESLPWVTFLALAALWWLLVATGGPVS